MKFAGAGLTLSLAADFLLLFGAELHLLVGAGLRGSAGGLNGVLSPQTGNFSLSFNDSDFQGGLQLYQRYKRGLEDIQIICLENDSCTVHATFLEDSPEI